MKTLKMPRHSPALTLRVCLIAVACVLGTEANAAAIAVTYSLSGAGSSVPIASGTTLAFDSNSTVSVISTNSSLNAAWNAVTGTDHNVIDFSTGLNNATFTWTFADGNRLLGTLLENVSQLDQTGAGPFSQTFNFTGGTGEFAGASGSVSGTGVGTASGFTSSGNGTINAPNIPEPASSALFAGGLVVLLVAFRRSKADVTA